MKRKLLSVLLCAVMLITVLGCFASATEEKENYYLIVIPDNATATEEKSAEILAGNIGKITGEEPDTIIESELSDDAYCLYVGATSVADIAAVKAKPDGSYVIAPVDGGCAIYGAGNRGTIYGVFGFLRDYCGYSVFTKEAGAVTKATEITLPTEKTEYTSYFEYTSTDWHSPSDPVYAVANGISGLSSVSIPDDMGGGVGYIGGFCHTLSTSLCSADKYYDEHPEYFALRDGKRERSQLCLTNDDVKEIVLNEVFDILKEQHNPDAALQIISLTQNDNYEYCCCEKCAALDEENGSQSGTMITFVNYVADRVKEAGYNNVAIDTFAYQYTRKAPTNVKPADNVIVRLCTIECCFTHALEDASCEQNVELMTDLADWNEICDRIYVWDYTTNYARTAGIFPDFKIIQQNMQTFCEHGVKGVYEEGAYYVDYINTEFGELRAYLLCRLLRDPYCDFDAEMLAFCKHYYGEGGEQIVEFINRICDDAAKKHGEIYSKMTETFSLTNAEAKELDKLWQEAKEITTDEQCLANINRSEISWRYVKSSLGLCEFSGFFGRMRENKKLFADILASGATMLHEGTNAMTSDGVLMLSPVYSILPAEDWTDKNGPANILYFVAKVIIVITLLVCILLVIRAVKAKKKLFFIYPVVFGALFIALELNRGTYLAWNNMAYYVVTALVCLILGILLVTLTVLSKKVKPAITVILSFIGTVVFSLGYFLPLWLINICIYNGMGAKLSIAVAECCCAIIALVLTAITTARLKQKEAE